MRSELNLVATMALVALLSVSCWPGGGGGSGDSVGGDQAEGDSVCEPDCTGKGCGDDGCGGDCGPCDAGYLCTADDQCKKQPTCEMVAEITCGATAIGDTTALANEIQGYDCGDYDGSGGEAVYLFTPEETDTATALLTSYSQSQEVLVTQAACDQQTCLAYGAGTGLAQFEATAGLKYYIVVDGDQGGEGPFELTLECQSGCEPQCAGKECGDDGCYGSCGECPDDGVCYGGACGGPVDGCGVAPMAGCGGCQCEECVCEMLPECCEETWHDLCVQICVVECEGCTEGYCGDFACDADRGENCGTCPADCSCAPGEDCQAGECVPCVPSCAGKQCGNDGCGGSCGECGAGLTCKDYVCVESQGGGCEPTNTPGCGGCPCEECVCDMDFYCCETAWDNICVDECAQCGGCGGVEVCGNGNCSPPDGEDCESCPEDCLCPGGTHCKYGECIECEPDCAGKECGDDGCGDVCGKCPPGEPCVEGKCEKEPGEFGWPCEFNYECFSGFCIEAFGAKMCTTMCIEECPLGWECAQWIDGLPDVFYLCIPECTSNCLGKECGDDGCGDLCGECGDEQECVEGKCQDLPDEVCLNASPAQIDFGGKKVFTLAVLPLDILSCGDAPLEITDIAMKDGSSADFGLDDSSLDHDPSTEDPLVVPAEEMLSLAVMFMPTEAAPIDEQGNFVADTATIVIESNAPGGAVEVPLSGYGLDEE